MNKLTTILVIFLAMAASAMAQLRSFSSLAQAEPWWEMAKVEDVTKPGDYTLVREIPDMDSQDVDDFYFLLQAETTFTNPKIDTQVYTGTWANVNVELIGQQDRGVTARQTLLLLSTATNTSTLAALANMQMDKNEILDVFSLETGEKDTRALQWKNINPANSAALLAIADSALVSEFASGYLYVDREVKEEENGSLSFSVLFQKAAWNAWSGEDIDSWTFLRRGNPGRDRASLQKTWTGIAIADAQGAALDVSTNTNFITSGYAVTDTSWVDNKDESANIIQIQVQVNLTDMSSTKRITAFDVDTSKTDENMAAAITEETSQTPGQIVTTRNSVNAVGLNDHTYSTNTATADAEVSVTTSLDAFASNYVVTAVNETNREAAVTNQNAGAVVTATSEETDHGRFNNRRATDTALTDIVVSRSFADGIFSGMDSYIIRNTTNELTDGVAVTDGKIVQVKSEKNKYKLWDDTFSTNTAVQNVTNRESVALGVLSDQESETVVNTTDDAPDGVEVAGGVITEKASVVNEFGLRDITTATDTANINVTNAQTVALGVLSDSESESVANTTNTIGSGTEVANGVITQRKVSKNRWGLNDVDVSTDTANQDVTNSWADARSILSRTYTETVANQTNAVKAASSVSDGVISSVKSDLNKYNLHDVSRSSETAIPDVLLSTNRTLGVMSDQYSWTTDNQTNALTNATEVTNGVITKHSSEKNRFGMQRNSTSLDIANQNVTNATSTAITQFSRSGSQSVANTTNGTNTGVSVSNGTITTVKKTKNAHGLWDATTNTNKALAVTGVKQSKTITAFDTTSSTNSINLTSGTAFATDLTDGTILSHTIETNEHGLVDQSFGVKVAEQNVVAASNTAVTAFQTNVTVDTLAVTVTTNSPESSVSANVITKVDRKLRPDNLSDQSVNTTTLAPISDYSERVSVTAFGTATVTRAKNVLTPLTAPTNTTPGTLTIIENTRTEASAYDTMESEDVTTQGVVLSTNQTEDLYRTVEGSTTLAETSAGTQTFVSGEDTVTQVDSKKRPDSAWDVSQNTTTLKNVDDASKTTTATAFYSESRVEDKHANTNLAEVSIVTTNNVIQTHTSTKDETGKYDTVASERTPIVQLYTNVTRVTEFGGVTTIQGVNAANIADPTTISGTTVVSSVSGRMNNHELYDYTKQTQWHTDATNVNNGNTFTWSEYNESDKFWISLVYDATNVLSTTWYYAEWEHTVELYNTRTEAWNARANDANNVLDPVVGPFGEGLYYYHYRNRGTNDLPITEF